MSGKHYFNIITMRVAKAIIRYNVSKVLMTLSSFLIDRKLRTAKVRLMPFYHIRYPAHITLVIKRCVDTHRQGGKDRG